MTAAAAKRKKPPFDESVFFPTPDRRDMSTRARQWQLTARAFCAVDYFDPGPPSGRPVAIPSRELLFTTAVQIQHGDVDAAFDGLFEVVDELVLAKHFAELSDLLVAARLEQSLPLKILVGLLTITLPSRDYVRDARDLLVKEVRSRAFKAGGDGKVKAVLHGLE
jgi:hypothetical protein